MLILWYRSIKRTFYVEEIRDRVYAVTFTPQARGKHRVFVYLNGMEVCTRYIAGQTDT